MCYSTVKFRCCYYCYQEEKIEEHNMATQPDTRGLRPITIQQ